MCKTCPVFLQEHTAAIVIGKSVPAGTFLVMAPLCFSKRRIDRTVGTRAMP